MKRITLTALLASAVLLVSLAQSPGGVRGERQGRGMMNLEQLKKELSLTDDQVAKLKKINEESRTKMKNATKENREEIKSVREKHQASMKEILTTEQYEKLVKMRQSAQKERKKGRQK